MIDGGKSPDTADTADTSTGSASATDTVIDILRQRSRAINIDNALLLDSLVAIADREPAGFDTDEIAFALVWSQATARDQVEFGRYLQQVIKPVWAALCAGDLDITRARIFHQVLLAVDADIALAIAVDLVDGAGGWTTAQLRDRLRRAVLKADPDGAAKRTARTVAQRRVEMAPEYDGSPPCSE